MKVMYEVSSAPPLRSAWEKMPSHVHYEVLNKVFQECERQVIDSVFIDGAAAIRQEFDNESNSFT